MPGETHPPRQASDLSGVFIDLSEGSEVADRTFPLQQLIPVILDQGTVDFSA